MYAIKRELKLNNKEKTFFKECAGFSRFVYNYGLILVKESWNLGIKASDSQRISTIKKVFTNLTKKREEFKWTNKYSSRIYQNAFRNLTNAFARWRDQKLNAEMPTLKKKCNNCSFTVDSSSGLILVKEGYLIKIPTLGTFRLKEPIPFNCVSQTFTISKSGGKWHISFSIKAEKIPEMQHTERCVGVDLGIKTFATLSDGKTLSSPSSLKKAKIKLEKKQWRNRNKVLGNRQQKVKASKNALKYYEKLSKKHKQVADKREDFLQKETTKLARTYQEIKIEDLNVRGMLANHKLAEAVSLQGFSRFRELLEQKQKPYGFLLTIVDRWFPSSKTCSVCGHIQDMPLKERVYRCEHCHQVRDRDLNAAKNLESWINNLDK